MLVSNKTYCKLSMHSTLRKKGEGVMVFNATFNNISVISWLSILLVEKTGVPEENHQPAASQ
jgi:hypothetical protein